MYYIAFLCKIVNDIISDLCPVVPSVLLFCSIVDGDVSFIPKEANCGVPTFRLAMARSLDLVDSSVRAVKSLLDDIAEKMRDTLP